MFDALNILNAVNAFNILNLNTQAYLIYNMHVSLTSGELRVHVLLLDCHLYQYVLCQL